MRTADCSAVLFLAGPALLRGAGHQAVAPAFAIFEGWAFLLPTAGDFQIFFTLISAVRGGLPIVAMQPVRQGRRQFGCDKCTRHWVRGTHLRNHESWGQPLSLVD